MTKIEEQQLDFVYKCDQRVASLMRDCERLKKDGRKSRQLLKQAKADLQEAEFVFEAVRFYRAAIKWVDC